HGFPAGLRVPARSPTRAPSASAGKPCPRAGAWGLSDGPPCRGNLASQAPQEQQRQVVLLLGAAGEALDRDPRLLGAVDQGQPGARAAQDLREPLVAELL